MHLSGFLCFQGEDALPPAYSEGRSPRRLDRFSLCRGQILFDYGCCRLRTFASETAGKVCFGHLCGLRVLLSP
jgi:hypothetical protein